MESPLWQYHSWPPRSKEIRDQSGDWTDSHAGPPLNSVFQVIEEGRDGENLEKLSIETTVLNIHYVIHIIGDFNET